MELNTKLHRIAIAHNIDAHIIDKRLPRDGTYMLRGLDWGYGCLHYTGVWRERDTLENEIASWIGHANYHVNTHRWPAIAYWAGVTPSGRLLFMRNPKEIGYHAYNFNAEAIGISLDTTAGQVATPEMLHTTNLFLNILCDETPELVNIVRKVWFGHREAGWYDSRNYGTQCPGPEWIKNIQAFRDGQDFAPDIPEREMEPDKTVIDVPGRGKLWIIEQMFQRWRAMNAGTTIDPMGPVEAFGYPWTHMYGHGDEKIQVFERTVMRHREGVWPDKFDVQLDLLGQMVAQARYRMSEEPFQPVKPFDTTREHRYFPETKHSMSYGFRTYWEQYGGLDLYGYPISEEFVEGGKVVQYTERARLEWDNTHGQALRFHVALGRLGAEALDMGLIPQP